MLTKVVPLLLVVTTTVVNSQGAILSGLIPIIIQAGLNVILINLKRMDDVTVINNTHLVLPDSIQGFAVGSLTLNNTQIQGLKSMNIINCVAKDISTSDEAISISVDLYLDQVDLFTGYNIDVGVNEQIPLYGNGVLKLALSATNVTVSVNISMIDSSKISISDLDIQLYISDSPSYITGFWKNEDASKIVTGALNVLGKVFCMWFDYERTRINCTLSLIFKVVINHLLGAKQALAHDEHGCFKDDQYNIMRNLENMILYYDNGTFPRYFDSDATRRDLMKFYSDISQVIVDVLGKHDALFME